MHRALLFSKIDNTVFESSFMDYPYDPINVMMNVDLADLSLVFTTRHYMAGSGVEVYADKFILSSPSDDKPSSFRFCFRR